MKALLVIIVLLAMAGLLLEPGYVLLAYGTYTLETSLIALLLALLVLLLLGRLVYRVLWWLNPRHWRSRRD